MLHALCLYGLNRQLVAPVLQPFLEEYTEPLVNGIIIIIEGQCSAEARSLLFSCTDPEEDDRTVVSSTRFSHASSPASSSSSSHTTSVEYADWEQELGTFKTTLHRVPGCTPAVPISVEQGQLQKEAGPLWQRVPLPRAAAALL